MALAHELRDDGGPVRLRWARCADGAGVDLVFALEVPLREAIVALRAVSRLSACVRDSTALARMRAAERREQLVRALADTERDGAEPALSGDVVLALLGTAQTGLLSAEAVSRLRTCGPNLIERLRRQSLLLRLLAQFTSFFAVLLWIGGACALLAGMPQLGWAIFAVIVVNGTFSFLQEYRAERAVEALSRLLPHEVGVQRDGREVRLRSERIVVGDIVSLEEGDQVPADGQLLISEGLRVDQSALTGEPQPAFKLPAESDGHGHAPRQERHELVFAGTGVVGGAGRFVVSAIGMATEIGQIARMTQEVGEQESPLQRELARVVRLVTLLAIGCGVVAFALGVATGRLRLVEGFFFALGVIVANVPEGLLPTLTLALAMGVRRMVRHGSLVKRLSAVEGLGATTVICTDKTGTVTEGRMTARAAWAGGRAADLDPSAASPDICEMLEAAVLASQAGADHGDPTEVALVAAAARLGIDAERIRAERPLRAPYPFDSGRKRMTLVRQTGAGITAFVKGAPRETLKLCRAVRVDGRDVSLDAVLRERILGDHDRWAGEGLRLLAVARRDLPPDLLGAPANSVEGDLTLLGLVAVWDPPRREVPEAIAMCGRAGIRVIMATGDYGLTARSIARQIGLPVDRVVTGEELERLSPEGLRELLRVPGVLFARTSPAHKLAVVNALKALGEVVAVTGDGVNDAPALRAADTGVAMGRRGSEVAKEAAVMVITDDNFASIVEAVRQGRGTYANMGKFVTYIFASNVPEMVPFLCFVLLGVPLPLTVLQILAVDLGTDMLPALALGAEPPEPDVMDQPPRRRGERLLGWRRLVRAYAFLGVIEAALAMLAFFWTYWLAGWRPGLPMASSGELYQRATTMTLCGIVAAQIGNVFACRTDRESVFRAGLLRNRLVLWGIAAEVAVLLALIGVPPLRSAFGLAPPSFEEWRLLLAFPPVVLALEEARKWIVRGRGVGAGTGVALIP